MLLALSDQLQGNLNGLVNNAAINPSRNDIINTDYSDWIETLNVNITELLTAQRRQSNRYWIREEGAT